MNSPAGISTIGVSPGRRHEGFGFSERSSCTADGPCPSKDGEHHGAQHQRMAAWRISRSSRATQRLVVDHIDHSRVKFMRASCVVTSSSVKAAMSELKKSRRNTVGAP
jgi:hypothetical protein